MRNAPPTRPGSVTPASPGKPVIDGPARYLYAFTHDLPEGPLADLEGLPGARVVVVADGRVAAVVSPCPLGKVRPERQRVAGHHHVLKHLQDTLGKAILPASFGMVADSEEDLRALLRHHTAAIAEGLVRVQGKVEMTVKLRWAPDNVAQAVLGRDPELRQLRDQLYSNGQTPTRDQSLDLGRRFHHALERQRDHYAAYLRAALSPLLSELVEEDLRDERDLVHWACLIENQRRAGFEAALDRLAEELEDDLVLELTGPWPPHHFVDLDLDDDHDDDEEE